MHYIQKHILDELRTVESMRYADLNKDGIESGHFRYHLMQMVKDGYIEQIERGLYRLTHAGQQFIDKLSANRVHAMEMPKVITYTLLQDGQKFILQKKPKQPYMGLLNMIGGKLHHGETSEQAALREVNEKAGLTNISPVLKGVFEILILRDDVVFTHVIAYTYAANISPSHPMDSSLVVLTAAELVDAKELAPDFLPIFNQIKDSKNVRVKTLNLKF